MIILITERIKDEQTAYEHLLVTHGVNATTLENVILPALPPYEIGVFNEDIGEWVIPDETESNN